MSINTISPAAQRIGVAGAFLLVSASAALGSYFGFIVGAHVHWSIGLVFAGAALGGELLKPFATAQAFQSFRSREFTQGIVCAGLAVVCVAYSFTSELSLAATSRGDMANERRLSGDLMNAAREKRTRAETELRLLPPARSPDTLAPLVTKLKGTRGANTCSPGDIRGSAAKDACSKVSELQSEAARWTQRTNLENVMADADRALLSVPSPVGEADPLASTVSAYANALGWQPTADKIAPWLVLIPVLFLEFGSALSLAVLRCSSQTASIAPSAAGSGCPVVQSLPVPPPKQSPASDQPEAKLKGIEPTAEISPPRNRHRADAKLAKALIEFLKSRGGSTVAAQRSIAEAIGASKSRVNELLHELAANGQIALRTSFAGSTIELAH